MFPDIDYLAWIEGRPDAAAHDLASSDLRPTPDGAIVPSALDGFDVPADATVESLVADRYDVEPEQVLVTAGASAANFIVAATALGDGETALVERPGYEPMWATPRALGANVDRFRRTREDVWTLDPDRVAAALVDDTVLVSVTNRHNPTGVSTSRDGLRVVAERVHDHGARLLVDEVYAPYGVSDDSDVPCAAGLEGSIVTGSLTKFLGLGGLRIGWLIADAPFVERATQVQRHLSAVAEPSRALARRALANDTELAARSRGLAASNHDLLRQFVAARPDLSGVVADGCPYALLFHEELDGDAVHDLAADRDVLVVPGRFFEESEAFRVALGRDTESMAAALDAFGAALDERAESA
ncbi:pyridoxal phosphate-dependent aminotransferase [Halorarius litoreus]|uniref:pyridoxal phosphate-dependent aminotransferase n=1 Tax=Halorarius litoreus TaxID=2962676 RepID=UPI0020CD9045|nr:pyridoxal phosphate-dependent aminotransferase [Halorarius litoreus]